MLNIKAADYCIASDNMCNMSKGLTAKYKKYNMKRGNTMIKAGIIGATGYAGAELVRILMNHKEVEIAWYGSRSYVDENYADIYGNMFQIVDAKCMDDNMEELAESVDVIFTATPQGFLAGVLTEDILSKVKITNLNNNRSMSYTIVSASEANLTEGKISVKSPIAQALLNKKPEDIVEVRVPAGMLRLRIDSVEL